MSHRRAIPAALALASLLALTLAAASCSHRVTAVDPDFTTPEGTFSPDARLIVWPDVPVELTVFVDHDPPDFDPGDEIKFVRPYRRSVPGAIHGLILDRTAAGQYQAFRTEDNGGVRRFTDFSAPRTKQWLETQWEAYHFVDPTPAAPARYFARGLIDRIANSRSPLSNPGVLGDGSIVPIDVTAVWWPLNATTYREQRGKLKVHWTQVPGADRYLIQVYQLRNDISNLDERILSGAPAPLYDGKSSEAFAGYVGPDVDLIFVGDSTNAAIEIMTLKPMSMTETFRVRVSAIDATGRMIGVTVEDFFEGFVRFGIARGFDGDHTYGLYPLGAQESRDTVTHVSLGARNIPTLGHGIGPRDVQDLPLGAAARLMRGWRQSR